MAVVVAGLQVLGDVGERAQVLRVLGCTGNIPDLVLRDDVLHRDERQRTAQQQDGSGKEITALSQHKENIKPRRTQLERDKQRRVVKI